MQSVPLLALSDAAESTVPKGSRVCQAGALECTRRGRAKAKASQARFGASPYERPVQARDTPLARTAQREAQPRLAVSSSVREDAGLPYSSFDAVFTHSVLQGRLEWPEWRFVTHAITQSRLPGSPTGRMLRHRVRGFPMPQVAVQVHRPFDSRRAVVFDARDVEGPLVVHDVHAGATTLSTLLRPDAPQAFVPILNALRAGLLEVRINGVLTSPQSVLDVTADVVLFGHVRDLPEAPRPVARPPTPPRPVELLPLESASHQDSTASASTASFSVVFGDTPPPRRWSRHPSAASSARASDVGEANWGMYYFRSRPAVRSCHHTSLQRVFLACGACAPQGSSSWASSRRQGAQSRPTRTAPTPGVCTQCSPRQHNGSASVPGVGAVLYFGHAKISFSFRAGHSPGGGMWHAACLPPVAGPRLAVLSGEWGAHWGSFF